LAALRSSGTVFRGTGEVDVASAGVDTPEDEEADDGEQQGRRQDDRAPEVE